MSKLLLLFFVILCVMLIVPGASSQVNPLVSARVDTNFVVGDAQLPAGEYVFTIDSLTNRMRITNTDTRKATVVFVEERVENFAPTEDRLIFQNDGRQSVLHKVRSTRMGHLYDISHNAEVVELE